MRYTTTPRWVYVMLIVMGIGFAAGAVPFWLFVPVSGHFVAVIWLLMGVGFVFFSMRTLAGRRDDERIRRDGLRATATVLSANVTGWTVNNVPQWVLKLRIDGAGASYETPMKLLTYDPPANGATFSVRVDPLKKQHVVMASDDEGDDVPAGAASAGAPSGASSGVTTIAPGVRVIDARGTDVRATVLDALRRAGIPEGSVITGGARNDAAETVRLLGELDRMHTSGTIGDAEFDTLKRKLLGEA